MVSVKLRQEKRKKCIKCGSILSIDSTECPVCNNTKLTEINVLVRV